MKAPVFYKIIPTSGIGGRGVNLKAIPEKGGQEVSQGGKRGAEEEGAAEGSSSWWNRRGVVRDGDGLGGEERHVEGDCSLRPATQGR